jgi:protein TonB
MIAAFAFNSSILLAFAAIPLLFPVALPPQVSSFLMEAFVPPKLQQLQQQPVQTAQRTIEAQYNPYTAPNTVPTSIYIPEIPETPVVTSSPSSLTDPNNDLSRKPASVPAVQPDAQTRLRVSTYVEEGLLIEKRMPVYPAIAKATGTSGTVILAAIISKNGTIENLHVISGPLMLQQAALDAVRAWRYRPYLLDGQPVEVETTVSVIFTLQR